jgi:hypothetical protein
MPPCVVKKADEYGSTVAIEQQLLKKVIEKSTFMTGPLMSSAESYASKRNDLLSYIADQVEKGVYKTESHDAGWFRRRIASSCCQKICLTCSQAS